jgi:hypothetical protein
VGCCTGYVFGAANYKTTIKTELAHFIVKPVPIITDHFGLDSVAGFAKRKQIKCPDYVIFGIFAFARHVYWVRVTLKLLKF